MDESFISFNLLNIDFYRKKTKFVRTLLYIKDM